MQPSSSDTNVTDEQQPTEETRQEQTMEQVAVEQSDEQAALIMLTALARQLEFYFSPANLSRDVYLQTLQQLNDGHVPVSILQNFTKIQAICPSVEREAAIVEAVTHHSPLLQVVHIDTRTSKQVMDVEKEDCSSTILAVGPRTEASVQETPLAAVVTPKSPIQNTIILREVSDSIKEEDVRELFQGLTCCPPLQHVRLDVANCWFVTLDTTSRDEMMQVMLDLRNHTLKGEAVKARLKTAATPTNSTVNLDIHFPAIHLVDATAPPSPTRSKKKKKNRRKAKPKKGSSSTSPSPVINQHKNKDEHSTTKSPKTTKATTPLPPKIQEELHFPSLAGNIVDKVACRVEEEEKGVGHLKQPSSADGASTATTASSATSSTSAAPPVMAAGAYAAALLSSKGSAPKTTAESSTNNDVHKKSQGSTTLATDRQSNEQSVALSETVEEPKEKIAAIPMSWGSGRSFAQVLQKKEQSSC